MRVTEEQLRNAAVKAREKELAALPAEMHCPDYETSEQFEQTVKQILMQLEQGTLKPDTVRMGWQYYTKRSAAVILLCTGLACAAMPETVMAACQRIIETVEKVFEEYTEFRFGSSTENKVGFIPVTLNYLPDDMKVVRYREFSNGMVVRYENQKDYFSLEQTFVHNNNDLVYILDTEDAQVEKQIYDGKEVTIILKNGLYQYMMICDSCTIVGETSLPYEELINILKNLTMN